jgi:hypothetical protein
MHGVRPLDDRKDVLIVGLDSLGDGKLFQSRFELPGQHVPFRRPHVL